MLKSLTKLLGGSDDKVIKRLQSTIEEINSLEPEFEKLSDEQLREKTAEFRRDLDSGQTLDDVLPEAFAVVREAAKRAAWNVD